MKHLVKLMYQMMDNVTSLYLLLDGQIIFDDWEGGLYGTTEVGALLSPGNHSLELRYWNQATFFGNSRVSFDVSSPDVLVWCE